MRNRIAQVSVRGVGEKAQILRSEWLIEPVDVAPVVADRLRDARVVDRPGERIARGQMDERERDRDRDYQDDRGLSGATEKKC
jgi:hypothetical protein